MSYAVPIRRTNLLARPPGWTPPVAYPWEGGVAESTDFIDTLKIYEYPLDTDFFLSLNV
jgi:hypothetical protein